MRPRTAYPTPPPRLAEVEEQLVPAIDAHHQRLDRLQALCAPIEDTPGAAPEPSGLFRWWTAAPAPSAEDRLADAWRQAVLLRDRAARTEVERDALQAQLAAIGAWHDVLARGRDLALAAAHDDDSAAFHRAIEVVSSVRDTIGGVLPLLVRLHQALESLADEHERRALESEGDVRAGARPSVDASGSISLDDVVQRLRACAIDRAAIHRALAHRLPLHVHDSGHERALDEVTDAQDPVLAWQRRRKDAP